MGRTGRRTTLTGGRGFGEDDDMGERLVERDKM
jgi:hypothetical protein